MDVDSPVAEIKPGQDNGSSGSLAAGFMSGCIATCLGHPLDTLKVRRQVSYLPTAIGSAGAAPTVPALAATPSLRQLYRGVLPPMLTTGAVQAVFFVIYERIRSALPFRDRAAPNYYINTFSSGFLAGVAISIITNPISLMKVQLQTSVETGVLQCFKEIYSRSGVLGLYKGMVPMVLMESAGRGVFFASYEHTKRWLSGDVDESVIPLWCRMGAASMSGCISWAVIYPLDVVKSRVQMAYPAGDPRGAGSPPSMRQIARTIYNDGGLRGLYIGLGFTLLRAAPISSIGLPLYEMCRQALTEASSLF